MMGAKPQFDAKAATSQEMGATKTSWQMMGATPQVGERRPQPGMRDEGGQRHKLVKTITDQE